MATKSKHEIEVGTKGTAKARQELGGVANSLSSMAKKAALAGAAYFSAQGIISGMKKAVELAGEQEQAEKQLEKALGKNISSLKAYASAQQQVTTFGDEVTLRAAAQFAQFTKNESQIKQLLTVTQDYAAAQGVDLVSAAQLVAKSFGSSTNALSRYGVEVTGAAGSTERLTSMTENMSRMFGGQAAAAADTMAGQIEQMNNAIGDAFETLGNLLAPAVIGFADAVKGAADWMGKFLTKMSENNLESAIRGIDSLGEGASKLRVELAKISTESQIKDIEKQLKDAFSGEVVDLQEQITEKIGQMNSAAIRAAGVEASLAKIQKQRVEIIEQAKQATGAEQEALLDKASALRADEQLMRESSRQLSNVRDRYADQVEELQEYLPMLTKLATLRERLNNLESGAVETGGELAKIIPLQVAGYSDLSVPLESSADLAERLLTHEEKLAMAKEATIGFLREQPGALARANAAFKGNSEITKRLAQTQAVIDTYAAANAAMKAMSGIPIVGPALGAAAAAAAIAAGLANVAQIEAQKFARGGDFMTSGPQLIMVGDNPGGRERVQITPTSSPNLEGPRGGGVTINLQAGIVEQGTVAELADRLAHRLRRNLA